MRSPWRSKPVEFVICSFVLLFASRTAPAKAQEFGKVSQVYAGFTFANVNRLDQSGVQGILLGGAFAQTRWLRWTAELADLHNETGYHNVDTSIGLGGRDLPQVVGQIHAGPEFTINKSRVTLFFHTLPGYSNWELRAGQTLPVGYTGIQAAEGSTEGGFSIATGGGFELPLSFRWGFRVSADYIPTFNHSNTDAFFAASVTAPVPPSRNVFHAIRLGASLAYTWKR